MADEKTRSVKDYLDEVRVAIGPLTPLTAAERREKKGEWYLGARDFGQRAAYYRDAYAAHLPNVPYTGADLLAVLDEVQELEAHLHALERSVRLAGDALLRKRGVALRLARGVFHRMRALLADPFLAAGLRRDLQACLARLGGRGCQEFDQAPVAALLADEGSETTEDDA